MSRARPLSAAFVALAWAALGCAPKDVVLADLPATDGGESGEGQRCVDDVDCPPSALCEKAACGDLSGTCEIPPAFCDGAAAPVCGCDGVTYWNDCLRRLGKSRASTVGPCTNGAPCGGPGGALCPATGASCARLIPQPDRCDANAPGVCWVVPATCPPPGSGPLWVACAPGPAPCLDACTAIQSEAPYRAAGPPDCPAH